MKQQTTLLATIATASAIKLSSKMDFFGIDIPDIPGVPDIPDILGDGVEIMGDGLDDFGDMMEDGYNITKEGLEDIGNTTYDGLNNIGESTLNGLDTIGEELYDVGESTYDGLQIGTDFVETQGSEIGNFVEDDVGGFVVDDIGGSFTDAYDWTSSEGNWEAFGKTLLAGGALVFEGDFDGAYDVLSNEELYTEEFWDDLE